MPGHCWARFNIYPLSGRPLPPTPHINLRPGIDPPEVMNPGLGGRGPSGARETYRALRSESWDANSLRRSDPIRCESAQARFTQTWLSQPEGSPGLIFSLSAVRSASLRVGVGCLPRVPPLEGLAAPRTHPSSPQSPTRTPPPYTLPTRSALPVPQAPPTPGPAPQLHGHWKPARRRLLSEASSVTAEPGPAAPASIRRDVPGPLAAPAPPRRRPASGSEALVWAWLPHPKGASTATQPYAAAGRRTHAAAAARTPPCQPSRRPPESPRPQPDRLRRDSAVGLA